MRNLQQFVEKRMFNGVFTNSKALYLKHAKLVQSSFSSHYFGRLCCDFVEFHREFDTLKVCYKNRYPLYMVD